MSAPRNLADMPHHFVAIELIDIAEWHPERDGQGRPTQVHLMLQLKGQPETLHVLRFHGPDTLAQIVNALTEHGANVFGRDFTAHWETASPLHQAAWEAAALAVLAGQAQQDAARDAQDDDPP